MPGISALGEGICHFPLQAGRQLASAGDLIDRHFDTDVFSVEYAGSPAALKKMRHWSVMAWCYQSSLASDRISAAKADGQAKI